jgi:hypothetical protein
VPLNSSDHTRFQSPPELELLELDDEELDDELEDELDEELDEELEDELDELDDDELDEELEDELDDELDEEELDDELLPEPLLPPDEPPWQAASSDTLSESTATLIVRAKRTENDFIGCSFGVRPG